MKAIILTKGRIATVDDEDFGKVNQFKWIASRTIRGHYYAKRAVTILGSPGKQRTLGMHNFLLGESFVDHRNGDGLDNRRENLRAASHSLNRRAFHRKRFGSSEFRGVSWDAGHKKWAAYIWVENRRNIRLGRFEDEEDAARAYDAAAKEHYGEFGHLNFPE